ncbi:hypothetical protein [Priestia megaterium]|uniref:hypothetical protein n=1 Tax=Priestia megaterium TaxID=1404 RepID=UPI003CC58134
MRKVSNIERVGKVNKNRFGSVMKVMTYNSSSDIIVKFENEVLVHTNWQAFQNGKVENPYDKSVCGIGYIGEGKYQSFKEGKITPQYKSWKSMLVRCYGNSKIDNYEECFVCDEWHNFQNFGKWYDENYYKINEERMELDKDILLKGNKIYSSKTSVFVPRFINCLFTKSNKARGTLPIGVSYVNKTDKYRVRCNDGKKATVYLGLYSSLDEAFNVYKNYKEKTIKQIAEEYRENIPSNLYSAMITYKVEIND